MAFVIACDNTNISGKAANHVKMKPKGSGNCIMTIRKRQKAAKTLSNVCSK